ncbi:MAG: hypothetical protein AVDCRST_MAG73-2256, partial [uncultured Thermomicrobiales bacterium]
GAFLGHAAPAAAVPAAGGGVASRRPGAGARQGGPRRRRDLHGIADRSGPRSNSRRGPTRRPVRLALRRSPGRAVQSTRRGGGPPRPVWDHADRAGRGPDHPARHRQVAGGQGGSRRGPVGHSDGAPPVGDVLPAL